MLGGMQDWELRVSSLIDHAARQHGSRDIVSHWADGRRTQGNWAEVRHDAKRMVQALRGLGIGQADRVATLAMNHQHHLSSWYGATGAGGILHTINPRLFDDQLDYIVNHAEDRVLFYDAAFRPVVERLKPRWRSVERYICYDDGEFDAWIGDEDGDVDWVSGSERDACMLCYTSGTTGNPKGVVYEHRSTILHAMAILQPGIFAMENRSVVMPIVPMFHAASWGLPWAGAMVGAKFVYSAVNDAPVICDLLRTERVTHAAGVPTVWLSVFNHVDETGEGLPSTIRQVVCGGTAMPESMIARMMRAGIRVCHAWGMTETSPVGTATTEPADWDEWSFEEQVAFKTKQGRSPYGTQVRCVDLGDCTRVLPRDGKTNGALQIRGPWVVKRYFKGDADAVDVEQWFDTGDVAVINPDGTVQLTDRTKDVIKSGGEWISSVALENAAMGHPAVLEAAAIGVHHPKWDERPLLLVVRKPGMDVTAAEIRELLAKKVAKWWLPDVIEFVESLPHTGTGKVSKKDLRELYSDYRLEA